MKKHILLIILLLLITSQSTTANTFYVNNNLLNIKTPQTITEKATLLLIFEPQHFTFNTQTKQWILKNLANPQLNMVLHDTTNRDLSYPNFKYSPDVGYYYYFDNNQYGIVKNDPSINPEGKSFSAVVVFMPVSFKGTGNNAIIDKPYIKHSKPYYQYHLGVTGDLYSAQHRPSLGTWYSIGNNFYIGYTHVQNNNWYILAMSIDCEHKVMKTYIVGITDTVNYYSEKHLPSCNNIDYGKDLYIMKFGNLNYYTPGGLKFIGIYKDRAIDYKYIITLKTYLLMKRNIVTPPNPNSNNLINYQNIINYLYTPDNHFSIDSENNIVFSGVYDGDNTLSSKSIIKLTDLIKSNQFTLEIVASSPQYHQSNSAGTQTIGVYGAKGMSMFIGFGVSSNTKKLFIRASPHDNPTSYTDYTVENTYTLNKFYKFVISVINAKSPDCTMNVKVYDYDTGELIKEFNNLSYPRIYKAENCDFKYIGIYDGTDDNIPINIKIKYIRVINEHSHVRFVFRQVEAIPI